MSKIMKFFMALVLSFGIMMGVAKADHQFYADGFGQWSIEGYNSDNGPYCTAITYYSDGSFVSIVKYANRDFYMIVNNTEFNIGDPEGDNPDYVAYTDFYNKYGNRINSLKGIYTVINPDKIIFYGLTESFFRNWVVASDMWIYMPGNIPDLKVGLSGTRAMLSSFDKCLSRI